MKRLSTCILYATNHRREQVFRAKRISSCIHILLIIKKKKKKKNLYIDVTKKKKFPLFSSFEKNIQSKDQEE